MFTTYPISASSDMMRDLHYQTSPRLALRCRTRRRRAFPVESKMINACTIVARNYLAYARVLAASFLAHHPGGQFRVLLIDDEDGSAGSQAADLHCHRLRDIGLSARDVAHLVAIYDVTELATAVKPQFLRFLLDSGWDHVIYL